MSSTLKVRQQVVAGRIHNRDGAVKYIQVEGGLDAGYSGAALVDTNGRVNAVVAAAAPGSSLCLGIPVEYVRHLLSGGVLRLQPGQAVIAGGAVRQPLRATIADPLRQLATASVDLWAGKPGKPRPAPAAAKPQAVDGDGPRVSVQLTYDATRALPPGESFVGTAETNLPPLKPGEVYWVRPHYHRKDGTDRWGEALVVEMGRFAVEPKPATLAVRHQRVVTPAGGRKVSFESGQRFAFDIAGLPASGGDQGMRVVLTERYRSIAANGDATMQVRYTDVNLRDSDGDPEAHKRIRDLFQSITAIETEVTVTREGQYHSPKPILAFVPVADRPVVRRIDEKVMSSIGLLSAELPGREVRHGATWPVEMIYVLTTPGRDRQKALFRMTCRYVGSRVRDGREEAVIELDGRVETPAPERRPGRGVSGVASGAVIVDVATGQTTLGRLESDLAVLFPYMLPNPQQPGQGMVLTVSAGVHLDMTVRRSLTADEPKGLDPNVLLPVRSINLRPHVGAVSAAPGPR